MAKENSYNKHLLPDLTFHLSQRHNFPWGTNILWLLIVHIAMCIVLLGMREKLLRCCIKYPLFLMDLEAQRLIATVLRV